MAPQDYLTAERAAKFLKQHFTEILRDDGEPWVGDVELIQDLIKTARQEALREACIAVSQFSSDGRPIDAQELRIALVQLLGEMAK